MQKHAVEEDLIGYVHGTLTDAAREALDRHLAGCPACRAQLSDHQRAYRRLRETLRAEVAAAEAPQGMSYAAIAPQVHRRAGNRLGTSVDRLAPALASFAAVAGAFMAFLSLFRDVSWDPLGLAASASPTLPLGACFLFSIPALANARRSPLAHPREGWLRLLAVALWLGTAFVGLYEIAILREMVFRIAILWVDNTVQAQALALTLGNWGTFLLGAVWIAMVVGGGEFHYRNFGRRRSWQLFVWTILAELAVLVVAGVV